MKLGICYMVFDGEELLEFAVKSIRNQVDHISVTYQDVSYFGNPAGPELFPTLEGLRKQGLIDEIIFYEPNFSMTPKDNELALRNIGLDASIAAGCTHHISSDVDEMYQADQLEYAKSAMDGYDLSFAPYAVYFKDPTYLLHPYESRYFHNLISFIHPVTNRYNKDVKPPTFPYPVEPTRRLEHADKYRVFTKDETTIHHMSYVRKDIRKKYANSDNGQYINIEKFVADYENYRLGDRICLLPDFLNRRTIQVENIFGINLHPHHHR